LLPIPSLESTVQTRICLVDERDWLPTSTNVVAFLVAYGCARNGEASRKQLPSILALVNVLLLRVHTALHPPPPRRNVQSILNFLAFVYLMISSRSFLLDRSPPNRSLARWTNSRVAVHTGRRSFQSR